MPIRLRRKDVFLNCPFDDGYKPIFHAIVFAIHDLGFVARCARDVDDASQVRLEKIMRIIEEWAYGIHDISSVGLGATTNLPRFNMPVELGLYLGCRRFGDPSQHKKVCLILDSDPYRYRAFLSDISGQDIHAHGGKPNRAISEVRDWLANSSGTKGLPGGSEIVSRYAQFNKDLPGLCRDLRRKPKELTFKEFSEMVNGWR